MKEQYYNETAERMPRESIIALQSNLLRKLLSYVWDRQPLYRKKMEHLRLAPKDIHGIEDITLLPFTDKQDLCNNYPLGMQAADKQQIVRINATSGTTGNMAIIPCTQNDVQLFTEGLCRAYAMQGCKPGFIVQNAFSYSMFIGGMGVQNAVEKLGATIIPTSTGNTKRQIRFLKDFQVDCLSCTPSYALHIIEEMKKEGYTKNDLSLKSCFLSGEKISEAGYQRISDMLGAKAYDVYGNAEMTNVFASCQYDTGKHIPEDIIYAEIIGPDQKPLPPGQAGELVVTTLQKDGLPLIRYRTHDIAVLYDSPCPCGRTGRRIGRVLGRTDDMITIRGCKVFPSQIESIIHQQNFLSGKYQMIVSKDNGIDNLLIKAELLPHASKTDCNKILFEAFYSYLGFSVKTELLPIGELSPSNGEKSKPILDMRKNEI